MGKIDFAIIGGGVAGLTACIALQKLGKNVILFDRSKPLSGIGAGFGLAANAMRAFDLLGMKEAVLPIGHFLDSYQLLDQRGKTLASPDAISMSKNFKEDNFAVHRADLHQHLLSQIDPKNIILDKTATHSVELDDNQRVYFTDGTFVDASYVLVADGVNSRLRQQLIPNSVARYAGYTCWRAVIDNSTVQLKKGSETWGREGRFGMTPLTNDRIYWYACINSKPKNPKYAQFHISDLQKQFASYHNPIPQILALTKDEDLLWNDIIDIKPIKRFAFHRILLIGDAAHATTPNMGQGACQAIEDVAVLIDELKKNQPVETSFVNFENRRLARTAYITNTSWRIGKVAQWDNPLLISLRDNIMRLLPESVKQGPLKKLTSQDFMTLYNGK